MSVATPIDFRDALSEKLEASADWRRLKAEEYPDDARNARSADALEQAAEYVRGLDKTHRGLDRFADFAYELLLWTRTEHVAENASEVLGGSEAMSPFYFDGQRDRPRVGDFERLLRDVHEETLEGWRETILENGDQPPRELVSYFEACDVPFWRHEEQAQKPT
jgi:hypothetical protein